MRAGEGQTSFRQKVGLCFLGIFLSFLILELGMRLGGFVLLAVQESRNLAALKQKGSYRIMCLGESTTEAGPEPYPEQLEKILNEKNTGIKFIVINKGVSAITSSYIVEHLEENLNQVNPSMVVVMMGINDDGSHMPWEYTCANKHPSFFQSLRTYKLIRLLWLHMIAKADEMRPRKQSSGWQPGLSAAQGSGGRPVKKDESPGYSSPGGPRSLDEEENINLGLAHGYIKKAKYAEAEKVFKTMIKQNSKSYEAYYGLGWIYDREDRLKESETFFKKAIELGPQYEKAYFDLSRSYCTFGEYVQAAKYLEQADEAIPHNSEVNFRLGWVYKLQGKDKEAQEKFKKSIEFLCPKENDPDADKAYGRLAMLFGEIGEPGTADAYYKKADKLRAGTYNPVTVANYRKLKETLDKRGTKLVIVQYPVRSVEPLKKIFEKEAGVAFVDNEKVFKNALANGGYKECFTDIFGGDFGHCTVMGNRILARNVADTVLKECLKTGS